METINLTKLASTLQAYKNCIASNNIDWREKHLEFIESECLKLPSGSGIDNGITFDFENSSPGKLIFSLGFHHMNDNGYYEGWTDHKLVITPTFGHFNIKITGPNKRQIKDYLYDLFYSLFTV